MKNVLFLTNGIHVRTNGRAIASYGYCKEFAKYTNLKVFASIPHNVDKEDVCARIDKDLDLEFCQEEKFTVWNLLSRIGELIQFKTNGIIEISKPNTYHAAERYIRENKVDIIIIDHIGLARFFFYLKKRFPNIIYVYNSHNAEGINYYQQLTGKNYPMDNLKQLQFSNRKERQMFEQFSSIERRLLQEADYTIAISKGDLELLERQYGISRDKLLLTKPLTKFSRVKSMGDMCKFNNKILIVGSMNWYPNVRGILWFIDNVFCKLIKKNKNYKLYVVGRGPTQELIDKCRTYPNNIVLTGEVESTEPYFSMCDISIVPVFEGTGIKIKVIESMARGIPTICSDYAAKDYDINGEVAVARCAQDYLEYIDSIEKSVEVRQNYWNKMKEYCEQYYELTDDMKILFGV